MGDRTTPIGLFNFGLAYLDTARAAFAANDRIRFADPIEFLCAHSVELIFKADIIRSEDLDQVRRSHGHDLLSLRRAISEQICEKFQLDEAFDNCLKYLSIGHSSPNFRNRYLLTGVRETLSSEQILFALRNFSNADRSWVGAHFQKVIL